MSLNSIEPTVKGWLAFLGTWWCQFWHDEITKPVENHYTCLECGRRFKVNF